MALNKVEYTHDQTVISADNLNAIQDAIIENEQAIADILNGELGNGTSSKPNNTPTVVSSWNDLADKPFESVVHCVWDEQSEYAEAVPIPEDMGVPINRFAKVSDDAPDTSFFIGKTYIETGMKNGMPYTDRTELTEDDFYQLTDTAYAVANFFVCTETTDFGAFVLTSGIWAYDDWKPDFGDYPTSMKILTLKYIDEDVIPDTIARATDIVGEYGYGKNSEIFNDYDENGAEGEYSHAEGKETLAYGNYSHAQGYKTRAYGLASHASGGSTKAVGSGSNASGSGTVAYGDGSSTENKHTFTAGENAHAEGRGVYARLKLSNYIANSTTAYFEVFSDAEATHSTFTMVKDCVGGYAIIHSAAAGFSLSEIEYKDISAKIIDVDLSDVNNQTITFDKPLFTEDMRTVYLSVYTSGAFGSASHSEGDGTVAQGECQHVQGKFNIRDTEERYAHIVGNGKVDSVSDIDPRELITRSNAHTIDWDGNAWFAGDVYVGGASQDDGEKLAKLSDVCVLTSPNGTKYRITVDDNGNLTTRLVEN